MAQHNVRLLKLELRNFMSYGNNFTTFNLDFNKPVLILGRNLDSTVDGQVDSNGAGKTAILQAISYVCYDDTIAAVKSEKIKVDALINFINKKNMMVALEFYNKRYYRIERFRKYENTGQQGAKGTGVYFLGKDDPNEPWNYKPRAEGGHDITKDSTGSVNDAIAEKIGLPFEVFSRLVIISADSAPFLSLPLDAQRDIVEELFGFTELTEKAEKLKKLISANNIELASLQKLNDAIKAERERYAIQLEKAQTNVATWDEAQALKIKVSEKTLADFQMKFGSVDFQDEEAKYASIKTMEADIAKLENAHVLLQRDLKLVEQKIGHAISWDRDHANELQTLEAKLKQKLIFKTIEETREFDKQLKVFDDEVAKYDRLAAEARAFIAGELNKIKLLDKDIQSNRLTVDRKTKEMDKLKGDMAHLADSRCPYCAQQFEATKEKISEITNKIEILKTEISALMETTTALLEKKETVTTSLTMYEADAANKEHWSSHHTAQKAELLTATFGSAKINLKTEYQKVTAHQQAQTEYDIKKDAANPYTAELSLEEQTQLKADLVAEIAGSTARITDANAAKKDLQRTLKFGPNANDMSAARYNLKAWQTELDRHRADVNPYLKSVESILAAPPGELKTVQIQELHETLEHQELLQKLLTKKDSFVRKALVNRYIPFLNTRIKNYLDKIGLPHKVEFQQDMSVNITQFRAEYMFGGTSKGQKARINLALALSFRDVLQSRYGAINFCILDECLDTGLGNVGVQLAAKMFKEVAKEHHLSMLLISHRDEIASMFDSKLIVELKRGFSNIVHSDI